MRQDRFMVGDPLAGYLGGLPRARAEELARVNGPGLAALRKYLGAGDAVAFLGAGASAPLYPLWNGLIEELIEAAATRLSEPEAETCRRLARESPESVAEIVRRALGPGAYRDVLRQVLRARTDPETGRSWTAVQELVCRCAFKAVVTTNYDPGILNARLLARPGAATGFTTWEDELGLDRWRTGDVFGEDELPVLFAHGQHNRPDSIVLAATEYRRAYAGKLPHVLARLVDGGHLVWIGFSFADQRIGAILREIANQTGTRVDPGGAPRHVAVMAWDPDAAGNDPGVLARRAEIEYGARLMLYPAPGNSHAALALLLADLTDDRYLAASDQPGRSQPAMAGRRVTGGQPAVPVTWVPPPELVEHFTGRTEELARLDRWAADPQVALIGVSAWGGAGKTALVTRWVAAADLSRRPGLRGVYGWSFYADSSAEHWAEGLLEWARQDLGVTVPESGRLAEAVLVVLRSAPVLAVLDGLEVVQEGPAGNGFGRLLDGTLREVLAGVCQQPAASLVLLTSRFPFADLEGFEGTAARMLEVPPFTPAEGSALLAASGGGWLPDRERRDLVRAVDGHALATGVLARLLSERPPADDLASLRAELGQAARTDVRVGKVLDFYSARMAEPDRYLLAAISLFARPVPPEVLLEVADQPTFRSQLAGWTPAMVQAAMTGRLGGLAYWHPDGTVSAHPLVRDRFRHLVLFAAVPAAEISLEDVPGGTVTNWDDALRVVEAIELLTDAGQWQAAANVYRNRTGGPDLWETLAAVRLGQRATTAFVATPVRRQTCETELGLRRLSIYLNEAGRFAMQAGDLAAAREYLPLAERGYRDAGDMRGLAIHLENVAECHIHLGQLGPARKAAAESLAIAEAHGTRREIRRSRAFLAWAAGLAGDTAEAERQFTAADQIEYGEISGDHLRGAAGAWWAEWLARTGREGPALALSERGARFCRQSGWRDDLARCNRMLGRLALTAGEIAAAGEHLAAAVAVFRDGDFLIELAVTLADLADHARATGDLDAADQHATEAITIAAPRGLVPAQSAALAAWARIRADAAATEPDLLHQGRDAADAALRLSSRHQLAWHELDGLRAHAALDHAEGSDRGWAAKADAVHARLVPPGLDPNPLATVESLAAALGSRPGRGSA
jgi:tetratricopeptide (TPR) repeat protein